jgi:hypothetical protein
MTKNSIHSGSLAEALFTSQARLAVLKLLLLNPDRRFYLREIAATAVLLTTNPHSHAERGPF